MWLKWKNLKCIIQIKPSHWFGPRSVEYEIYKKAMKIVMHVVTNSDSWLFVSFSMLNINGSLHVRFIFIVWGIRTKYILHIHYTNH